MTTHYGSEDLLTLKFGTIIPWVVLKNYLQINRKAVAIVEYIHVRRLTKQLTSWFNDHGYQVPLLHKLLFILVFL
jgi:hypothetical protein